MENNTILNGTLVPLLAAPAADAERVDEALYGMTARILEEGCGAPRTGAKPGSAGAYCRIRMFYRYEGYADSRFLIRDERLVRLWQKADRCLVDRAFADILDRPQVTGRLLAEVTKGAVVRLLPPVSDAFSPDSAPPICSAADIAARSRDGWVEIALADGRTGYMKAAFLSPLPRMLRFGESAGPGEESGAGGSAPVPQGKAQDRFRRRLVRTAMSYLGTQYRWGGRSPLGIDCSGLVSIAYLLNGVIIYRDSQLREGFPMRECSLKNARPGDALYFPGHIAMYLGKGRYIHSTARAGSDGVVVGSLNPGDRGFRPDLRASISAAGSIF